MARILSIDYGKKRTGIAVTDPLQLIATGLTTVESKDLLKFLKEYMAREPVETIVLGEPRDLRNRPTHATPLVEDLKRRLGQAFPGLEVVSLDERFTSKMAVQSMVESGMKKQQRRNKALIDEIAATILLQGYLASQKS